MTALPLRWTQLRSHPVQAGYYDSRHRFNVVPAGRRSGKTELAKRRLVRAAVGAQTEWAPRFFAAAPTYGQAKRIYWEDLKALSRGFASKISESALSIYYPNGAMLCIIGMDQPARVEGSPWDGGVLDEYGNMKPQVWPHHVRPALSDRMGWCDFIGVPEGRNHYYELDMKAIVESHKNKHSEWGHFHWISADILPATEIEAAKRDLDELTYLQEYEASFVNFEGRAYYPFSRDKHTGSLEYNPHKPLAIAFDFNVAPGVAAIIQEQELPGQWQKNSEGQILFDAQGKRIPIHGTGVLGEVYIPRNSNTVAVCRKFIEMFGSHKGEVIAYGDATGGASGSAKVMGSDWDLIKEALRGFFGARFSVRVKTSNPAERARVNAVNSRLKSGIGEIRLMVDGTKAPNMVKDFEGVTTLKGGSGEIDKKIDPTKTHLTDAAGYYVDYEFPVVRPFVGVSPLRA